MHRSQHIKEIVLLIMFFLLKLQAGAQGVFIGFHVPWHDATCLEKLPVNYNSYNKNTYYLTFDGATFPDQQTMFPHYEISLSDIKNLDETRIRLHILKTEPVLPEALKKINNLEQLQAIFQMNYENYKQRKKQVKLYTRDCTNKPLIKRIRNHEDRYVIYSRFSDINYNDW